MENESATKSKKGMSPMMIGGIIVLVIALAAVAVFATKNNPSSTSQTSNAPTEAVKNDSMMKSATTTPGAMMKEGSSSEEKTEGAIKTFEVDASNFKFAPNKLTVNEGDTVKITFKNTGGMHNFNIDEFNAKSKTIQTGQTDELMFVASKKGSFEFYCSVGNHRAMGMVGTLTVM